MLRRWIKKRELMAYHILRRYVEVMGTNSINVGDAVEILRDVHGSKRVARNVLRSLIKKGLLVREKPHVYSVVPLTDMLDKIAVHYIAGRLRRRGLEVDVDEQNKVVIIEIGEADMPCESLRRLGEVVSALGYRLRPSPDNTACVTE